ncbi:hypothetical protein SAMN05660845_0790 [Flavobacterium swingsii]|jgi:hypothetical protein|uniref:Uncharacterized protein n=1 Tax=Flavobacterium swingsii TaxID=498292 RepID=A0A1I0WHU8_9FLAO|nr:hypothetical protein [Flavobacterium swingsii]SFA88211.1 hypothetical protein SAMN05660845_0790 [Flavobacterium swingsii]
MKTKIFLAIIITSLISCNKIDELLTFSVTNQASFTVNSGFLVNSPLEIPTPDVTTNSSSNFSNNNTRADLVKDVKLQELKLTITNPTDKTFSFLKSVHIYISTNANDEVELAYADNIVSTANTINLTCTSQRLDAYLKASSYKLRTKVTTKETVNQDVTIKADMRFSVVADPL